MDHGHYIYDVDTGLWWDGGAEWTANTDRAARYERIDHAADEAKRTGRESAQILLIMPLGMVHEYFD